MQSFIVRPASVWVLLVYDKIFGHLYFLQKGPLATGRTGFMPQIAVNDLLVQVVNDLLVQIVNDLLVQVG